MTSEQESTINRLWCGHYTCFVPNPPHLILRKCPNGHRCELWYCSKHVNRMMELAVSNEAELLCRKCDYSTILQLVQEQV